MLIKGRPWTKRRGCLTDISCMACCVMSSAQSTFTWSTLPASGDTGDLRRGEFELMHDPGIRYTQDH